jgi:hypothetical protein
MNERIRQLAEQADLVGISGTSVFTGRPPGYVTEEQILKFAELIVRECVNREALLGAIARGWCSEKNSHKTMDSDLAVAIFDEVEKQIREHFGVEE